MPATASDVAARERGDAAEAAQQVQRRPLAGEQGPRAPSTRATVTGVSSTASPSVESGSKPTSGSSARNTASATASPQTTPGCLSSSAARQRLVGVEEPVARRVAGPDVLLERRLDDTRQLGCREGDQIHGSKARLLPAPVDDVHRQGRILGRVVGPEVAAAALLRGRAPPRRRAARAGAAARGGVSRPAASRTSPACSHMARRSVRRDGRRGSARVASRARLGRSGSCQGGERSSAPEDEAFEQRVRREPVRPVDPGAGALAGRVQAGHLRAPVEVGDDAAHRVVGRRGDGHRLRGRIEACVDERAHERGEARCGRPGAGRAAPFPATPTARATTSRGASSSVKRSPSPSRRSAPSPRSASLRRSPPPREHGRMELDELEVGERRARAPGEQRAVADRAGRVRRPLPERGHAAGRQHRGRGADRPRVGHGSHAAAVMLAEPEHARVLDERSRWDRASGAFPQGPRDVLAGLRAPGVDDPAARMPTLEAEVRVEARRRASTRSATRAAASSTSVSTALGRQRPRPARSVSSACKRGGVVLAERRGDAALGAPARRRGPRGARDERDRGALRGRRQGGGEAGEA